MAIFNSYVKLPEGNFFRIFFVISLWMHLLRSSAAPDFCTRFQGPQTAGKSLRLDEFTGNPF